MLRPRNEHTIAAECVVTGRGYWTGCKVTVRFRPAPAETGIRLVRSDLPGYPSCSAISQHSDGQSMRTNIAVGAAKFQMVEHLMAALYALEIDNCIVEISSEELPGLDGSSLPYIEALQSVGLVMQALARKRYFVDRVVRVGDAANWIEMSPSTHGCAVFEYRLDYGDQGPIPTQQFSHILTPSNFVRELAGARTFVTAEQADRLRASGVGTHVTNQDLLVFDSSGAVIDNQLRFGNECARHKTLDLIGDLSLVGIDLIGHFISYRGGHQLNSKLAVMLTRFAKKSYMSEGVGSQSAPPVSVRTRAA